jgi:hypothetical protein
MREAALPHHDVLSHLPLRGHSSQPPQPDRYPQYRAVRFSPPELSPGVSGRPRRKTDKTAPGRAPTRHSVGRSPVDEYEAGRQIQEVRRGEHDEQ